VRQSKAEGELKHGGKKNWEVRWDNGSPGVLNVAVGQFSFPEGVQSAASLTLKTPLDFSSVLLAAIDSGHPCHHPTLRRGPGTN
jgi:hypothetical protein